MIARNCRSSELEGSCTPRTESALPPLVRGRMRKNSDSRGVKSRSLQLAFEVVSGGLDRRRALIYRPDLVLGHAIAIARARYWCSPRIKH